MPLYPAASCLVNQPLLGPGTCFSAANNCVRNKHGWICTDQINTEAVNLGYESVRCNATGTPSY
jgi:hypothetical protein